MSINEINAEAKESLRKYFKNSQDVKHENEARKELTKEEIFESVCRRNQRIRNEIRTKKSNEKHITTRCKRSI